MSVRLRIVIGLLALVALVAVFRPTVAVVTYRHAISPGPRAVVPLREYEPSQRIIFGLDPIGTERRYLSRLTCASIDIFPLETSVYGLWRGLPRLGQGGGKGDCGIVPDDRPWVRVSW